MLRSRADDLRQDAASLNRQISAAGLRSPEDKHNLIASYLRLALDCVRSQIFVCLEGLKQNTETLCLQKADGNVRQAEHTGLASQRLML